MMYKWDELIWLFFIYSFLGWILETITAAIKNKRFVNRGLVNSPFCVLYGISAIFITIFCSELKGIWLFIGSVILATLFEWIAGHLIEKIYHERWWDYSQFRFNLDGYIALEMSVLWGVLSCIMMRWGNSLFLHLLNKIPSVINLIIIGTMIVLLAVDMLATLIILKGKSKKIHQWKCVEQWLTNHTFWLEQRIYSYVERRIQKAYPKAKKLSYENRSTEIFAYGCSFYKLVWLFMIGAFLGDVIETIFCRIVGGIWMSRSSVVWGPFSIVWGGAIVLGTFLLYKYSEKADRVLFLAGTLIGGTFEYICSVFSELVFGKVFWDYSNIPFNLGGRINLLYCLFWGIAAVVWIKMLYPKISNRIEKIPMKTGKMISWIMIIFMCCNMMVSGMALVRSSERQRDIPAQYTWQRIMDERFDDERLKEIYPNAISTLDK